MPRFQKGDRIRTVRDWRKARRARVRTATPALSVLAAPAGKKRLGVVAGSDVGSAVVRNRIKRVVREYFRLNRDVFPQGDCVVIVKPMAKDLANGEIRGELARALEKIGEKK